VISSVPILSFSESLRRAVSVASRIGAREQAQCRLGLEFEAHLRPSDTEAFAIAAGAFIGCSKPRVGNPPTAVQILEDFSPRIRGVARERRRGAGGGFWTRRLTFRRRSLTNHEA
jgi:hypothetical protein